MPTSFDQLPRPLPTAKLEELESVKQLIIHQFETSALEFTLEKIILFGSYATGKQVEDKYVQKGITYEYKSDFDILVVSNQSISDKNWFKLGIDDLVDNHPTIETEVNIIHHDIHFLNKKISENYYFFTDMAKEGIELYDSGRHELATPGPMTPAEQGQKAQEEFEYWFRKADDFYAGFELLREKKDYSTAAFLLHQATESYYSALLLVFTDYRPKWHNLKKLGRQVASIAPRLKDVFPQRNKEEQRLFQLLKKAYIDSRYRKDYAITAQELQYLAERVLLLRALTEALCQKEIARLKGI